jgi:hypothetical protein
MILFFTSPGHHYTLKGILKSPHRTAQVAVRSYDWLARQQSVSASTCIFTDLDRLRHFELAFAARMHRQLKEGGVRVLNDPAQACQREELLFRLHKAGMNRFRAYRATLDPRPARFPVFFKCAAGHSQDISDLFWNQDELDRAIERLRTQGFPLTHMLVIEFANRPCREGVYRRHTIYRIGDRMVPANMVMEGSPFVKYGDVSVITDADRAEAIKEIDRNPHAETMLPVFQIAGIEFGRADFGFDEDTPAVYEINTNPTIGLRIKSSHKPLKEAVDRSMKLVSQAVGALERETHTVRLRHDRRWFSRLSIGLAPRMKQP